MQKRRYEILLPLKYNDGRSVEKEKFYQTREELVLHFGAISLQPNVIQGIWVHQGIRYEEDPMRFVVDVEDLPENRQFFIDFKKQLLQRFDQIDIYIASHPVEIV